MTVAVSVTLAMATKTKTRTRTNAKPNAAPKTAMATPLLSAVLLAVLGRHASAAAGGGSPPYPGRVLSGGPGGSVTFPLVPHHVQAARRGLSGEEPPAGERRRRRRVAEDANANANAKGVTKDPEQMGVLYMGYGTHYADLWVGTPPQRQTVIVDTGSAQTAFPCGGCKDCGFPQHHLSAYFEEALSSTFEKAVCDDCTRKATCNTQKDRCEIEQYYTEGSAWEAYEANDTVYAGGFHGKALLEVGSPRGVCRVVYCVVLSCVTWLARFRLALALSVLTRVLRPLFLWFPVWVFRLAGSVDFPLLGTRRDLRRPGPQPRGGPGISAAVWLPDDGHRSLQDAAGRRDHGHVRRKKRLLAPDVPGRKDPLQTVFPVFFSAPPLLQGGDPGGGHDAGGDRRAPAPPPDGLHHDEGDPQHAAPEEKERLL